MVFDVDNIFQNLKIVTTFDYLGDIVSWYRNHVKRDLKNDVMQLLRNIKDLPQCTGRPSNKLQVFRKMANTNSGFAVSKQCSIPPFVMFKPAGTAAANTVAGTANGLLMIFVIDFD